jgi:hypothetical protein
MKKLKASKKKPVQANKKEAVHADRKKTPHQTIACSPEVKPLVLKLRQDWKNLGVDERVSRLQDIVSPGCSVRSLASDLDVPEATLRRHHKKFLSTAEPKPATVKTEVAHEKSVESDVAHDRLHETLDLTETIDRPAMKNPIRDQSDEVADIILDFCKNAVPADPIRDSDLPLLLEEVKKCLGGDIRLSLAFIPLPKKLSLPNLYQVSRPPEFFGDTKLRSRARWLATIVRSVAPESIRETAFAKATQRAAELMPQSIPGEKKPTRIHPLQIIEHGFSLRNRR